MDYDRVDFSSYRATSLFDIVTHNLSETTEVALYDDRRYATQRGYNFNHPRSFINIGSCTYITRSRSVY